jgi:hypothetical protein
LGRGLLLIFLPFAMELPRARAFVLLAEGELLSLAWPRESNQREGHPAYSLSGHPCPESPRSGSGVCRQGNLPRRQTGLHPCKPPCGLILHPPAAAEGPRVEQRASCAYSVGRRVAAAKATGHEPIP